MKPYKFGVKSNQSRKLESPKTGFEMGHETDTKCDSIWKINLKVFKYFKT